MALAPAQAAALDVVVSNVRNAKGEIRVAVCSKANFLQEECDYKGRAPAHLGSVTVRIEGVPAGTWAVQAFHDENLNSEVDRNVLGLPTEGIGFSNDATFNFGPPSFRDAAFHLGPNGGLIRLSLRYLL